MAGKYGVVHSEKPVKICGVCGDRAKSFHFGGLSCDSCKAFFLRAVHGDTYKSYVCTFGNNCEITLMRRKRCKKCRFQKCLSIGMEPGWVMGEEERKRFKARLEKKRLSSQVVVSVRKRTLEPHVPDTKMLPEFLDKEEQMVIQYLLAKVTESIREYPFDEETRRGQRVTHMFTKVILRYNHVVKMMPSFATLSPEDQQILIRAAVLEICLLVGSLAYDKDKDYYVIPQYLHTGEQEAIVPVALEMDGLKSLLVPELYELNLRFIRGMQELRPDRPIIMLLILLLVFCPEREGLSDPARVSTLQEKYILILKKYMEWRYGRRNSSVLFPKYISKLSDLQEISDLHTEDNVFLQPGDVEELEEALGHLNLSPYTQFDIRKYRNRHLSVGTAAASAAGDDQINTSQRHSWAGSHQDQVQMSTPEISVTGSDASPNDTGYNIPNLSVLLGPSQQGNSSPRYDLLSVLGNSLDRSPPEMVYTYSPVSLYDSSNDESSSAAGDNEASSRTDNEEFYQCLEESSNLFSEPNQNMDSWLDDLFLPNL